jgi:hypothetical protein
MTDTSGELPGLGKPFHPTLQQLIAHLQSGTLSELTRDDPVDLIAIDSSPKQAGATWTGPDGRSVQSFLCKFAPKFPGWQPGDIVNAKFVVSTTGDRVGLLVSDAYIGDIRHADTFYLPDLSDEDRQALVACGMASIDADVEIIGRRKYVVSNMFDYEARVHRMNAVQPVWDGLGDLTDGDHVLVQGNVVRYEPGEADYRNARFPTVDLKLKNGKVVTIEMTNGYIYYETGSLDVMYPSVLQVGDVVQINSTYSNSSTWSQHADRSPTLHAAFCRSAHLVKPGWRREAVYNLTRQHVRESLDALKDLGGAEFRAASGRLLNSCLREDAHRGTFAGLVMTEPEIAELKGMIISKFPVYRANRPIGCFDTELSEIANINRKYGVDVFSMSRADFYDFLLKLANGRAAINPLVNGSTDYPYRIMREEFSPGLCFDVLSQAVEHWVPMASGKEVVHGPELVTDPSRQIPFDLSYLAEQSVGYLASVCDSSDRAREYFYDFAVETLRHEIAQAKREDGVARDEAVKGAAFGSPAIRGLEQLVIATAEWSYDQGLVDVRDAAGLDFFVRKRPELRALRRDLERVGLRFEAKALDQFITRTTEIKASARQAGGAQTQASPGVG